MLNEKQQNTIELLSKGYTIKEVAKMLGIGERTIYTWKKENQEFISTLDSKMKLNKVVNETKNINEFNIKSREQLGKLYDVIYTLATEGRNESVRLSASTFLIDKMQGKDNEGITLTDNNKEEVDQKEMEEHFQEIIKKFKLGGN